MQVGGEVAGALGEGVSHHGAAQFLKGLGEVVDQARAIVLTQHVEGVGYLDAQVGEGKVGQHVALEIIGVADAPVERITQRDARVGAGGADGGDAGRLKDGGGGHGRAGAVGAKHHVHIAANQCLGRGGGFVG